MTTPVEPPAPPTTRISAVWYALVVVPWILAFAVWYVHLPRVIAGLADLRSKTFTSVTEPIAEDTELERVTLHAGENEIYVEGVDVRGETEARSALTCVLFDGDRVVPLEHDTTSTTTMRIGSSTYVSQYEATLEHAGDYRIGCSSTLEARYSIGRTFPFLSIVWLVLSMILALPLTGVIGYSVNRLRNGKRKTARVT